jgi:hypothetical protein
MLVSSSKPLRGLLGEHEFGSIHAYTSAGMSEHVANGVGEFDFPWT